MKTAKLVIGIVSIVLSVFVLFQSCAAGIGNAIANNGETSGSSGLFVAICLLIAGIVGIAARTAKGGAIASGIVYALGGLIGASNVGTYKDLAIWSVLSFIFAVVFILSIFWGQEYPQKQNTTKQE
ncbi:hypothetical protein [Caproiciproducens galactitolivorans]|uniref:Lipoprotein n=1 Tax=Caproiciproducens galactitolivorans TaxID=642589 RepID=A0ABT4BWG1_9FIRM|nr:hypothetical protein [Caproiciproducens galactitolivorans]MCY1715229.1 hypothetical protein [Caproiciproducens galactitolivorans]